MMHAYLNRIEEILISAKEESIGGNVFDEAKSLLMEVEDELNDLEQQKNSEIRKLKNHLENLEEENQELSAKFEDMLEYSTMQDEMKQAILVDLHRNLTLEQLEYLEQIAADVLRMQCKQYFSMNRIIKPI